LQVQLLAEDALARQLSQIAGRNVRDGAVLVADTQTGEVLAYVASAGDASHAAEVDGVRAHRQAGSTLKPFLYELAIERGYLTAASLLDDSPVNLDTASGLYIPQNYDRDFKGLVSVRSALGNSLNVPAVRALVLTGVDAFRDRLFDLGYSAISKDGDYYGYSLALGSAEVSVWEQAQAYRALARGGLYTPLRLLPAPPPVADRRLLSAAGSFVVADILADRAARALTFGPDNHLNTTFWSAVKTGTSKDMRDNWCIGFSPRYTVAVWVGNFEGDSMHDVSGVTGAAPVWAEVMDALHRGLESGPPRPPPGVAAKQVAFTPAVEAPRTEWFLDGTERANVQGVPAAAAMARIDSPGNSTVIALDPDIPPAAQRVPIRARGAVDDLQFRLDGQLLGHADRTVLWAPQSGHHRLVLEDRAGQAVDRVQFTVR
jgi:penicillin-binding protein 1C